MAIQNVLEEVSDRTNINGDVGLLKLYEKWLKCDSPRLESILKEKGLLGKSQ